VVIYYNNNLYSLVQIRHIPISNWGMEMIKKDSLTKKINQAVKDYWPHGTVFLSGVALSGLGKLIGGDVKTILPLIIPAMEIFSYGAGNSFKPKTYLLYGAGVAVPYHKELYSWTLELLPQIYTYACQIAEKGLENLEKIKNFF